MKHYEITISNGNHPLVYRCSTIAEAFGCLLEVSAWASHVNIDPDGLMQTLVFMKYGDLLSHEICGSYRIKVVKEEEV